MDNKKEMPVIKVENVSKKFGEQHVLSEVSVSCFSGEICGIVGHNGSGKTVLFKCICGLVYPNKGEIWIRDKKMHKDLDMLNEAG